jgi:hypothetical protein
MLRGGREAKGKDGITSKEPACFKIGHRQVKLNDSYNTVHR